LIQKRESLDRSHRIRVHLAELIDHRMRQRAEQPKLFPGVSLSRLRRSLSFHACLSRGTAEGRNDLLTLEERKQFPRPFEYHGGKSRKTPDLDPIRSAGTTRYEPVQKEHLISDFPDFDTIVASCY
jgi:hypothetical protein